MLATIIFECPQLVESVIGAGGHCDGEISNSVDSVIWELSLLFGQ